MEEVSNKINHVIQLFELPVPAIRRTGPPFWCMGVGTVMLALLVVATLGLLPAVTGTTLAALAAAGLVSLIAGCTLFELEHKWWREAELERRRLAARVIEELAEAAKAVPGGEFAKPSGDT